MKRLPLITLITVLGVSAIAGTSWARPHHHPRPVPHPRPYPVPHPRPYPVPHPRPYPIPAPRPIPMPVPVPVPVPRFERVDLIATTALSNHYDRDTIRVHSCRTEREAVRALKLRVRGDGAHIDRIVVQFENGEWQELDVREHFSRNSESRWIDLRGSARCIREIMVVGQSNNGWGHWGQTMVDIYGLVVDRYRY